MFFYCTQCSLSVHTNTKAHKHKYTHTALFFWEPLICECSTIDVSHDHRCACGSRCAAPLRSPALTHITGLVCSTHRKQHQYEHQPSYPLLSFRKLRKSRSGVENRQCVNCWLDQGILHSRKFWKTVERTKCQLMVCVVYINEIYQVRHAFLSVPFCFTHIILCYSKL